MGGMGESLIQYRIRSTSGSNSNSLEQFLNSLGIKKLYNKGKLDDVNLIEKLVYNSKNNQSEKTRENFRRGRNKTGKAVELWKGKKKIQSVFYCFSSCLTCRLYVIVYLNIIRYKVGRKIYG
jgi:hypothetical protein